MPWQVTKRVDDVFIMSGPANDPIVFTIESKGEQHEAIDWTEIELSGKIMTVSGAEVGTWEFSDLGTTADELKVLVISDLPAPLTPGEMYLAGVRGTRGDFSITYLELELYPKQPSS